MPGVFLVFGIFYGFMLVITIGLTVIKFVGIWKVFTKAGQQGWKCLIPFYNLYVIGKIVKREYIAKVSIITTVISAVCLIMTLSSVTLWNAAPGYGSNGPDARIAGVIIYVIFWSASVIFLLMSKLLIYLVRAFLVDAFNINSAFILLLIFLPTVGFLYLGFSKKYTYQYAVSDNNSTWC